MAAYTGRLAALGVIALLILVPLWTLVTPATGSVVWIAWAVVSIWAAVDAVRITIRAFPAHHTPIFALGVSLLALVNVVFALYLVFNPATSFWN